MPWNEPGGDKDPWNGKNNNNASSGGIDDLLKKLNGLFGNKSSKDGDNKGDSGNSLLILAVIGLIGWLFTGLYTIDERERGIVLQFGAYKATNSAGLHWHIPYPIQTVEIIDVDTNRQAEERSTMLTKDENIVDLSVSVQYKVKNAQDYLFNVANLDNINSPTGSTLYQAMRSSIREIVGRNSMDSIIKDGREQIAQDTHTVMQDILDSYNSGIQITKVNLTYAEAPTQVKDAFDDVNRARENSNQYKNEALAYQKKIIPQARGRAARTLEEADAYKNRIVAEAKGDASRFKQLVKEYQQAPEVTRERLYLETMENVMSNTQKIMVDTKSGNNLMYLPLDKLSTGNKQSQESQQSPVDSIGAAAMQQINQSSTSRSSTREPRTIGSR